MRNYQPMNLRGMISSGDISQELQKVQTYLRQLDRIIPQIPGLSTNPAPPPVPPGHVAPILDDYFFLPGRSTGQIAYGDTSASGILVISSTRSATKGKIYLGSNRISAYDEFNSRLGIKVTTPAASLHVKGEPPSIEYRTVVSDNTVGTWTPTPLWQQCDENATTINDADFISSGGADSVYMNISAGSGTPPPGATVTCKWRGKVSAGTSNIFATLQENASTQRALLDSGTSSTSFTTYSYTMTPAEVAAVGNWANLQFKFARAAAVVVSISACWLEISTAGGAASGDKTAIFQVDAGQTVNNTEWQNSGGTSLISVSAAGKLIIEIGGVLQILFGAGANKVPVSDAAGNLSLTNLTLFTSIFDTTGTPAAGDIIYRNGSNQWARLPVGADGKALVLSAGLPSWQTVTTTPLETIGMYGDGRDGNVTLGAGTTSLTRDMYYDTLTVPNGAILDPNGWIVFCKTSCTVNAGGIIERDGGNGGVGGNANAAVAPSSGAAGLGLRDDGFNALGGSGAGTAGKANAAKGAGSGATSSPTGMWGEGGDGGGGGNSESNQFGAGNATGGAGTATTDFFRRRLDPIFNINFLQLIEGGTGGRGGASGGGDGGSWGASGGGGGGGGGVIAIYAKDITNNGTIRANGGTGGAGGNSDGAGGAGGGGGGAGGGAIYLYYDTITAGTIQVNGGTGGAAGTSGGAGFVGPATAGGNGTAGATVKYNRLTGVWS